MKRMHYAIVAALVFFGAAPAAAQDAAAIQAALQKAWEASPHADVEARAFTHWDKDGAVPPRCSTCHSGDGFRDFLGADGSTPGKIDKPAATRSVIGCQSCHNEQAKALNTVAFPSGVTVDGLDGSARCMVCHQGRSASASVTKATAGIGADTVSDKLRFINIHYRAAAATVFGTAVKGGFEYAGKTYHGKFTHPAQADSCIECHEPHSTMVQVATCNECHQGTAPPLIRTSKPDYDGDGDTKEGVAAEIATLHEALGKMITAYANDVLGEPIVYGSHYPYFFKDTDRDGKASKAESTRANAYASWTPRLLQAAYNYQFVGKDPGAYAHNPAYALQLLYDSLESLKAEVEVPGFSAMNRP